MNNLRKLRETNNFTLKSIAAKLQISDSTYSQWETGKREPSNQMLIKLASFFDVSTDYILAITNDLQQQDGKEKMSDYKSDLHKELINMINIFDREDLLMLKGYMVRIKEKYKDNLEGEKIG